MVIKSEAVGAASLVFFLEEPAGGTLTGLGASVELAQREAIKTKNGGAKSEIRFIPRLVRPIYGQWSTFSFSYANDTSGMLFSFSKYSMLISHETRKISLIRVFVGVLTSFGYLRP